MPSVSQGFIELIHKNLKPYIWEGEIEVGPGFPVTCCPICHAETILGDLQHDPRCYWFDKTVEPVNTLRR